MDSFYYSPSSDASSSSRQSASAPAVSSEHSCLHSEGGVTNDATAHPDAYSLSWVNQQQQTPTNYDSLFEIYGYAPESPLSEPEELDEDDSASYLDEPMDTEEDFSASPTSVHSPHFPYTSRTSLSGVDAAPTRTVDASHYPDASTSHSSPQLHGWPSHSHRKPTEGFHGSPQYAYHPETGIQYAYEHHDAAYEITDSVSAASQHPKTCSIHGCPCSISSSSSNAHHYYYTSSSASDSDGLTTTTFSSPDSSPQSEAASHPGFGTFPSSPLGTSPITHQGISPFGEHNNAQPAPRHAFHHSNNTYPAPSSPSAWDSPAQTYFYSKPSPFTSSLLPPPPPELPLHQPRPTRRFNLQKLDDLAALEAASYAKQQA